MLYRAMAIHRRICYTGGYIILPFMLSHSKKAHFKWWSMHPLTYSIPTASTTSCLLTKSQFGYSPTSALFCSIGSQLTTYYPLLVLLHNLNLCKTNIKSHIEIQTYFSPIGMFSHLLPNSLYNLFVRQMHPGITILF